MFLPINKGSAYRRPRKVINSAKIEFNDMTSRTSGAITSGTGAASAPDTNTLVLTSGASGYAYLANGAVSLTAGYYYAVSIYVEALTGTLSGDFMRMQGVATPSEGVASIGSPISGERMMMVFRASATETIDLRFGMVATANANVSMTLKNLMIQEMSDMSELSPYVPPTTGLQAYFLNFTDTGYWDQSNNTYVEGDKSTFSLRRNAVGIVIDDSFANSITEFGGIINDDLSDSFVYLNAEAGRTLENIADNIDTILGDETFQIKFNPTAGDVTLETQSYYPYPMFAIIGGGAVNSINLGGSSSNPLPGMITAFKAIVARCRAKGITPVARNCGPWAGYTSFSAANDDQLHTDAWNGWLKSYCEAEGIPLIDIYTGLEDKTNADNLANSATTVGTHDGAGNAAVLSDSTANFVPNALVGLTISNTTDGSTATITANTATTVTGTLSGGTDNDWDAADAYSIPSNDYSTDELHPNTAGYQVIADLAKPKIRVLN